MIHFGFSVFMMGDTGDELKERGERKEKREKGLWGVLHLRVNGCGGKGGMERMEISDGRCGNERVNEQKKGGQGRRHRKAKVIWKARASIPETADGRRVVFFCLLSFHLFGSEWPPKV